MFTGPMAAMRDFISLILCVGSRELFAGKQRRLLGNQILGLRVQFIHAGLAQMFPLGVIARPLHLVAAAIFAQLVQRLPRHAQSIVDFRCPPASLVPFLLPFGLVRLQAFAFGTQRRRLRLLRFVLACQVGVLRVDGALLRLQLPQLAPADRDILPPAVPQWPPRWQTARRAPLSRRAFSQVLPVGSRPPAVSPQSWQWLPPLRGWPLRGPALYVPIARVPRPHVAAPLRPARAAANFLLAAGQLIAQPPQLAARLIALECRGDQQFPGFDVLLGDFFQPQLGVSPRCFDAR